MVEEYFFCVLQSIFHELKKFSECLEKCLCHVLVYFVS